MPMTKSDYCDGRLDSRCVVMSEELVRELADEWGMGLRETRKNLALFGRTLQRRLCEGKASGIPFLGVVHVEFQYNRRFNTANLNRNSKKNFRKNGNHKEILVKPIWGQAKLSVSPSMKERISQAPHTGNLEVHYERAKLEKGKTSTLRRLERTRDIGGVNQDKREGATEKRPQKRKYARGPKELTPEVSPRRLRRGKNVG